MVKHLVPGESAQAVQPAFMALPHDRSMKQMDSELFPHPSPYMPSFGNRSFASSLSQEDSLARHQKNHPFLQQHSLFTKVRWY